MSAPFQPDIPPAVRWDLLVTIIGGLAVLLIYDMVRRRSPRAASWNERKATIYEQLRFRLHRVIQAQKPLSADEEAGEMQIPGQERLTQVEMERLASQSSAARQQIEAIVQEHGYMLAPRVVEILQRFHRLLHDGEVMGDTTRPDLVILLLAQEAHRDLVEFLPVEVGDARGLRWRLQRFRRWFRDRWYVYKGRARHLKWWLDTWAEDIGLLTGPKLTQDNVRNPPRVDHWRTVEQMEARPAPKGVFERMRRHLQIQRHLHEQLAADPPPWLPVPLSGRFHGWRDPESRKPSPRLHDDRLGPLRTGDAADVCAHGVPLTTACRPCGFVVMPKDFAWSVDLPQEDRPLRRGFGLRAALGPRKPPQ